MQINPNRYDYRGNIISQITFFWIEKLFLKGFRTSVKQEDLFPCPREQTSEYLNGKFERYWQMELGKRGRPDIKIALAKALKTYFIIGGVLFLLEGIFLIFQSLLISQLAASFIQNNTTKTTTSSNEIGTAICYALAIALILSCEALFRCTGNHLTFCTGIQLRTVCTTALFKKVMRLQQTTLRKTSIGQIINLISNDVYKLQFGVPYWNYVWISPIQIVLATVTTLFHIGPVALTGIAYIVLLIPLQIVIGLMFGRFRYLQSLTGDTRIELMDQIIRGMRVIKLFVWESPFIRYVREIRKREVRYASLAGFFQSTIFSLYNTSMFIALFISYSVSISINKPLTTAQLAFAFIVYSKLRIDCVLFFGSAVLSGRESVIALRRIQNILELPESNKYHLSHSPSSGLPSIKVVNFSASWKGTDNINDNDLVLKCINLTVDSPQLVAIAGPLGSGKTSLLMSLINELPGVSGQVLLNGISSYVAQQPWIFSGTFRDNILLGNALHSRRYQQVIAACCLTEDIAAFREGEMTLIGDRGVTLSGGQMARVSLARAIYQEADIYLLDDPLSAVDIMVGRDIFNNCVRGFLQDKIVVLVTHHVQFVRRADWIIVMKDGSAVCSGAYERIMDNGFCREFFLDMEKIEERDVSTIPRLESVVMVESIPTREVSENNDKPLSQALTAEDYRPNSASLITYLRYFWAGGLCATTLMLALSAVSNGSLFLSYWWMQSISSCLSELVNNVTEQNLYMNCPSYLSANNSAAIGLFTFFTFFGSFSNFLLGFTFYYVLLQASRRLHNRMLHRVMHCPMLFFAMNPSGRILNRFSKDTGFLDEQILYIFYYFWSSGIYIIYATLGTILTQYLFIIPLAVCLLLTILLRYYYLKTCTQVKRLESIARSPLYSHISRSLLGLSTIRALRIEQRVTRDFHYFQDQHSTAWYHYVICSKWFELRLDLLAVLIAISGVFIALFTHYIFNWDQLVGFSLPLLVTIPSAFYFSIRGSGDVEILIVSADRILNYCGLTQEKTCGASAQNQLKTNTPRGEIEFINLSFRYSRDLPCSLVFVSLHVLAGEKIGIIGRTGAGKSSLFNALCRMGEMPEGSIVIDGRDISLLNLYEHRMRLSVIAQDPVLFSGTLRYNLDPFDEFSGEEIWEAVENCHLKEMLKALPDQLMYRVLEDGSNFSTGERQLLCLARAVLRKNKVILIDEATANVDFRTDALIQEAIRTHFSECTVLTIAHRMETVIDSDRILVIDKGRVIDYESPSLMLENENSYLSQLLSHLDIFSQMKLRDLSLKSSNAKLRH